MHRATHPSIRPPLAATALAALTAFGAPAAAQDRAAGAGSPDGAAVSIVQEDAEAVPSDGAALAAAPAPEPVPLPTGPGGATAADLASAEASARILAAQDPLAAWEADRLRVLAPPEQGLAPFLWRARPVVVFADTPADPAFRQQMAFLAERADELAERDVVVIADTDPAQLSELRRLLRPRGFMMALVGKDGGVKLRKPFPWDVRELTRSIDKMPLRKQEVRALR